MKSKLFVIASVLVSGGLLWIAIQNYQSINNTIATRQVLSDSQSTKSTPKSRTKPKKSAPITTTPSTATTVTAQPSLYANDTKTGKLIDQLTSSLTYTKGSELKKVYADNKETLTGSFWSDIYGTVTTTNEPAIDAFASEIDTLHKTSKVTQPTLTANPDGSYTVILTVVQGGDKSSGAVNGNSIYQLKAVPTNVGFDVSLSNTLVAAN